MTTSTTLDKILSGSKKQELLEVLASSDMQTVAFGDFLKMLEEKKADLYLEAFKTISPVELVAALSGGSSKTSAPKTEVPAIENFKDDAVRAAWKAKVLETLEAGGMFETRGLSPAKIREIMGSGNEQQARELFGEMVTAGQIVSTGDTKGKKFVVTRLKADAERVHAEEVAKAKALKEKKDADKAAEAAKATPVATPATSEAPKAKQPAAKTK